MRGAYIMYGLGLLILILGTLYAFEHVSKQGATCTRGSSICRDTETV